METINISALPGQPSTFWKSTSGKWYTTKAAALRDDPAQAVNPEDYQISKSFFAKHKKQIIATAIMVAVVILYALGKAGKLKFLK